MGTPGDEAPIGSSAPPPPSYEKPEKPKPDCLRRDMPIVSRKKWGALPPKSVEPLEIPEVPHIIITYTKTRRCKDKEACRRKVREIQKKHMDKLGLPDIKFNFLVGGDGRVYEGRGWHAAPARDKIWPEITKKCLRIAYIGNYTKPKRPVRKLVGPAWELLEVGFVKDHIALDFQLHQKRHLPKVYNFVDDQPVLGVDYY